MKINPLSNVAEYSIHRVSLGGDGERLTHVGFLSRVV